MLLQARATCCYYTGNVKRLTISAVLSSAQRLVNRPMLLLRRSMRKRFADILVILTVQKLAKMMIRSAPPLAYTCVIIVEHCHIFVTNEYKGFSTSMKTYRRKRRNPEDDEFKLSHVLVAFTSLPRVLHLVWSTDAFLTGALAFISLIRGVVPAATVVITKLLIDSVVLGIRIHSVHPIWIPVGLQLVIGLLDRFLSTLSNITQQLLQDRVSTKVQLLILEK